MGFAYKATPEEFRKRCLEWGKRIRAEENPAEGVARRLGWLKSAWEARW